MGRLGDNVYYSQGCNGHGVTFTHVAGKALAEAIAGQPSCRTIPFQAGTCCECPSPLWEPWYYSLRNRLEF